MTQKILVASDAGYGFIATVADLASNKKAGKAFLSVPKGAAVKPLLPIVDEGVWVAAASNEGRLLLFPMADLPELVKGKGNKMISVPSKRVESREEFMAGATILRADQGLTVISGKRLLKIKPADLEHYQGERGRRGQKLPRGFQRVDQLMAGLG
ncbi:MAG TPA: hypothetical protein HPP65_08620 [Gammaproteobacteria bacterium]|nr:hypothetical protein [Gammaproteobacteria bacterium]